MPLEIEQKFLVHPKFTADFVGWDVIRQELIYQFYLPPTYDEDVNRLRLVYDWNPDRADDEPESPISYIEHTRKWKSSNDGLVRPETNEIITIAEARDIIDNLSDASLSYICKIRTTVDAIPDETWCIDDFIFHDGLVIVEREFGNVEDVIDDVPDWAQADVTSDPAFTNVRLVEDQLPIGVIVNLLFS